MRSARPGRERLFRWFAVSNLVLIPVILACLVAIYTLWGVSSADVWLVWFVIASLMGSVFITCGQWAVLTEGERPLLSAWLRVASLGAWMLTVLAYFGVAYLWLGWIAAVLLALLVIAVIVVDLLRARSRNSE